MIRYVQLYTHYIFLTYIDRIYTKRHIDALAYTLDRKSDLCILTDT
jgi:hypothetical protein